MFKKLKQKRLKNIERLEKRLEEREEIEKLYRVAEKEGKLHVFFADENVISHYIETERRIIAWRRKNNII